MRSFLIFYFTEIKRRISTFHKIKMENGFSIKFSMTKKMKKVKNHRTANWSWDVRIPSNLASYVCSTIKCDTVLVNHVPWIKLNIKLPRLIWQRFHLGMMRFNNWYFIPLRMVFVTAIHPVVNIKLFLKGRWVISCWYFSRLLVCHNSHSRKCDMPVKSETEWTLNSYK